MASRKLFRRLLPLALLGIAVATLTPGGGPRVDSFSLCLVCGERGLADVLLNIVLFTPLGIALAGCVRRRRSAVLLGAALSLTVELLQLLVIPGRDPTLSDLIFNTTGTALGFKIGYSAGRWSLPARREARRLAARALTAAFGLLFGLGFLLEPTFPDYVYFGQWTPEKKHLEPYLGQVLSARVGDLEVPSHELANWEAVRTHLIEGAPIRVEAIAGPPVTGLASIFGIYTRWRQEVFLVGVDSEDLVFRHYSRSHTFRLDQPDLRLRGAAQEFRPGEPLHLTIYRAGNGFCIEANDARACPVGYTVGNTWSVFLYYRSLAPWLLQLIGAVWLAALFAPAGYWLRGRGELALAGGLTLGGLALIPSLAGLIATTTAEYLAALAGLGGGVLCRRWIQRRTGAIAAGATADLRGEGSAMHSLRDA